MCKGEENDYMDIKDGNPLFTIIVAVLNSKESLERCIESVNNQTYPNKELIIKDGGSDDGTVEILKNNNDKITYWESSTDSGIYNAWNIALNHAKGEWFCFLGADDIFARNNVLEIIARSFFVASSKNIKVIYGKVQLINKSGKIVEARGRPWDQIKNTFLTGKMTISHQGCFQHRDIFLNYGLFDESFKIAGDYELLLRELKRNDALFVPELLTFMGSAGISNNPSYLLLSLREELRALKKHGLAKLNLWFTIKQLGLLMAKSVSYIAGEKYARILLDAYRIILFKKRKWTI